MSSPMDLILDKAKDLAKDGLIDAGQDYAQQLVDEHQALGPQVFNHVKKKLDEIDSEVNDYYTAFMVGGHEMRRGVVNEINYHSTCVRLFSRSEMERVNELTDIIGGLTVRSAKLEQEAEQRITAAIQQIERGFNSKQSKGPVAMDEAVRIGNEITRLMESKYKTVNAGNKLQAHCAEIIGKLNAIHRRLSSDKITINFSRKCKQWLDAKRKANGER
ncbi:MAG: hypothetical protein HY308_15980 [Gammaproteobacteria bacterium]|nr:hypothetical protein [Gammaproteobacteria bacterium]